MYHQYELQAWEDAIRGFVFILTIGILFNFAAEGLAALGYNKDLSQVLITCLGLLFIILACLHLDRVLFSLNQWLLAITKTVLLICVIFSGIAMVYLLLGTEMYLLLVGWVLFLLSAAALALSVFIARVFGFKYF